MLTNDNSKKGILTCILTGLILVIQLQGQVSLESILSNAKKQDPSLQAMHFVQLEKAQENKIVQSNYYPQFSINAQATYQSDVTTIDIPFPGIEIEPLDQDQYRVVGEFTQLVFDGGVIRTRKEMQNLQNEMESNELELNWKMVERQIIELYFGVIEIKSHIEECPRCYDNWHTLEQNKQEFQQRERSKPLDQVSLDLDNSFLDDLPSDLKN